MYLKDLNHHVTIRLRDDVYKKLDSVCKQKNVDMSKLLRYIIDFYISQLN